MPSSGDTLCTDARLRIASPAWGTSRLKSCGSHTYYEHAPCHCAADTRYYGCFRPGRYAWPSWRERTASRPRQRYKRESRVSGLRRCLQCHSAHGPVLLGALPDHVVPNAPCRRLAAAACFGRGGPARRRVGHQGGRSRGRGRATASRAGWHKGGAVIGGCARADSNGHRRLISERCRLQLQARVTGPAPSCHWYR